MNKLTFLPADDITDEDMEEVMQEMREEEKELKEQEFCKEQGLRGYGIINDLDFNKVPDKIIYSDGVMYAFVYDRSVLSSGDDMVRGYALWCCPVGDMHLDDWTEVSDLTGVTVFTYQRLRAIAVSIGWIKRSNFYWLI